jgi:hypothetical protein
MRSTVSYNGTVDWLSHHLRRLCNRGLAKRIQSQDDGRATDAVLTEKGMSAVVAAKPGHAALVRTLFVGALPDELLSPFTEAVEHIEASLNLDSSLPPFPLSVHQVVLRRRRVGLVQVLHFPGAIRALGLATYKPPGERDPWPS